MNNKEKLTLFRQRFIHRDDTYAQQWYKDGMMGYTRITSGVCPLNPPCLKKLCTHIQNVPITEETLYKHLKGEETIASYQLSEENTIRWMCLDVDLKKGSEDNEENRQKAKKHTLALGERFRSLFGRNGFLVERSGSKGWHLWVFFEPVSAFLAYSVGRWVDEKTPHPMEISVEVYPKQTLVGSYGSMVKLPLGVHQKTGVRCFFVNGRFEELEDQWDALANVRTFTEQELKDIISTYNVSLAKTIRYDTQQIDRLGALPCITNMMNEGLQEGARDEGMHVLAAWAKRRDIPESIASVMLHAVNEKSPYPLEENVVDTKLESAYNADYSDFPCRRAVLDSYCTSQCRFFEKKSRDRWQRFNREGNGVGIISRD